MSKKTTFRLPCDPAVSNTAVLCARAARWVWVLGIVQVVAFGLCGLSLSLIRFMPMDQLREMTDPPQYQQIIEAQPFLRTMVWMVVFLGFLPGLAYLALGFAVRREQRLAIDVLLLLAITQCIVFGFVLLGNVTQVVVASSPASLTLNVLILGSLLALLTRVMRCLWAARHLDRVDWELAETDPWNECES